jgi:hypothetical protein
VELFGELVRQVGLPLAMTISAVVVLARALLKSQAETTQAYQDRIADLKTQLEDMTEDRDYHRDRAYQALGFGEKALTVASEVVSGEHRGSTRRPQRGG